MVVKVKMGYAEQEVEIKQKDARKEHKILGVWMSPAGGNKKQKEDLRKK